ncbi:hypothetical protein ACFWFX_35890, partial [Streptomyces roseolus]|uniref:hypothetical protein n=1 Tax=Streptomyces roseolus TaxID=67358 RepID=UPI003649B3B5
MRDQRVSAVWRHEHVPVTCSEAVRMAAAGPTAASPGSIERIVAAVLIGIMLGHSIEAARWFDETTADKECR